MGKVRGSTEKTLRKTHRKPPRHAETMITEINSGFTMNAEASLGLSGEDGFDDRHAHAQSRTGSVVSQNKNGPGGGGIGQRVACPLSFA